MLPTEDLFVYAYVLVDDAIGARAIVIPARPGPAPARSDAELLAIALVRHLLGRRSEARGLGPSRRSHAIAPLCPPGVADRRRGADGSASPGLTVLGPPVAVPVASRLRWGHATRPR
jgi:hypothetical protein